MDSLRRDLVHHVGDDLAKVFEKNFAPLCAIDFETLLENQRGDARAELKIAHGERKWGIGKVKGEVRRLKEEEGNLSVWLFEDGVVNVPNEIGYVGFDKDKIVDELRGLVQAAKAAEVVVNKLEHVLGEMWTLDN